MNIKELNERLEKIVKILNETETTNLLNKVDKKTAEEILFELKTKLKKESSFSDSKIYQDEDFLCLDFRDWGSWENPEDKEDEEDYDWQVLEPQWKDILKKIVNSLNKKYGVNLNISISEKHWITISLMITQIKKDTNLNKEEQKNEPKEVKKLKQYLQRLCKKVGKIFDYWEFKTDKETSENYFCVRFAYDRIINSYYKIWAEFSWNKTYGNYTLSFPFKSIYHTYKIPYKWDLETFCNVVKTDFTKCLKVFKPKK